MKSINLLHRSVLRASGGRLGWRAMRMPVLELTTVGRRSGLPRTVLLTSPLQDDGAIIVVASKGGDDKTPAWFLNLVANPEVLVSMRDRPAESMIARVASAQERERLWPQVVAAHPNYGGYQARTSRQIPLVLLTPR
jgi:deazaflavin-dependent oxidoreductase (nitroreductase family)